MTRPKKPKLREWWLLKDVECPNPSFGCSTLKAAKACREYRLSGTPVIYEIVHVVEVPKRKAKR